MDGRGFSFPSNPLRDRNRGFQYMRPVGGMAVRGPAGDIVVVEPRVQARCNSLDDDSGSSAGTDPGDLHTCWARNLNAVRAQGLSRGLAERSSPEESLGSSMEDHIDQFNVFDQVHSSLNIQLPSRKPPATYSRTRKADKNKSKSANSSQSLSKTISESRDYRLASHSTGSDTINNLSVVLQNNLTLSPEQSNQAGPPPLPPRDYPITRLKSKPILEPPIEEPPPVPPLPPHRRQKLEIHPIMKDGQKISDTHYFFLENKQPRASPSNPAADPEDYHNVSTRNNPSTTLWEAPASSLRFGPPGSRPSAVGQRGERFLQKTSLLCCTGQERRLRRTRSDSERHLLTVSSESVSDSLDRTSLDSVSPSSVDRTAGMFNQGLDLSHDLTNDPSVNNTRTDSNPSRLDRLQRLVGLSRNLEQSATERSRFDVDLRQASEGLVCVCPDGLQCDCAVTSVRSELLSRLVDLGVASEADCIKALIQTEYNVDKAAEILMDTKPSLV